MPRNNKNISHSIPLWLPIAIRVYPEPPNVKPDKRSRKPPELPTGMLVFDTETRTDPTQRLTFGSYRFFVNGKCLEEGLFYADDLPVNEREILERYAATHQAETARGGIRELLLFKLSDFLAVFYSFAYKSRYLVVAFNQPFDLSRIACDFTSARGRFAGGFSLGLWQYIDKNGQQIPNSYRPRIGIKQIDSKRALKGFTARKKPDKTDLIPDGSLTGEPEPGYKFRGHFLDLRTLAFALTDRGHSLESACEDFRVEHGKQKVNHHGEVTEEYIDYNRRDVLATAELAFKLLEEYDKHPIELQATKAYSPASIGKAYLRAMEITPVLERQPHFSQEYLGYAQSAFFGGRASAHIRKVPVPVVYVDFLSMYPTVNSLMQLWRYVTAQEINVVEHCETEVEEFLKRMTPADLFKPDTWKQLPAFVKIIPNGDILPTRGKYNAETSDWQVGINHLYTNVMNGPQPLWFTLPDVVASVLLTGRIPQIVDAFRIEPRGTLPDLKSVKLRGAIEVNPKSEDFFKVVIEQRKRLSSRSDITDIEKKRLNKALKVLANAASYGIYAEMNRQESDQKTEVTCHGIDAKPFNCCVVHPEVPGEYYFSPLASLITGAARLMLALLEHSITELGGTNAMEDTDSMAIVASERGGLIPCPEGQYRKRDDRKIVNAVKALSWAQVQEIVHRFSALNPYDRNAVPGSILKIEGDNFDPKTHKQRQIYCLAISAKRYALFLRNREGTPALLREGDNNDSDRWSEHGLGHLLNPTDPESSDRDWIERAWLNIVRKALGLSTEKLGFEDLPAVGRVTVSSPTVMKSFTQINRGKEYPDQIKPFNFVLTCHVSPLGHPIGADPGRFHLIAPYENNSKKWLRMNWINLYTGKDYWITTTDDHGTRNSARVKTYGDILEEYEFHPESKCADTKGNTCGKQTVGLLYRRHIRIQSISCIGKESNKLEDVEAGLVHSEQGVYTEYRDPKRDEWQMNILPKLKRMPLSLLVKESGLSRRTLMDLRAGRSRPHLKNRELLAMIVKKYSSHPKAHNGMHNTSPEQDENLSIKRTTKRKTIRKTKRQKEKAKNKGESKQINKQTKTTRQSKKQQQK